MDRKRKSIRLPDYDYATPGAYLVTICSFGKKSVFGVVDGSSVVLSELGTLVERCWLELSLHFNNVELDTYIIMPDHIHGILGLYCRGTACRAQAVESFSSPVPNSLPTIIRSFKSAVTRRARLLDGWDKAAIWQRGYHEHVIRKTEDINRVREYILNNPLRRSLCRGE